MPACVSVVMGLVLAWVSFVMTESAWVSVVMTYVYDANMGVCCNGLDFDLDVCYND